ncbi:MAG TPA: FHA domain-containing serine/threonine-protein kinase, partial [Anaerolineales bacterium]|nr:FHA domain-containing serine/threonine-protein kinase [Anaerolineales bacterium]
SLNERYKIEALLGKGSMSSVYKALDPKLKRTVAVKLIHPHLSRDDNFVRRFKTEAATIAAFRHPNIVQVYDFDYDGENYFMVMEYIAGGSLQELLKHLKNTNTQMPLEQAVNITISVCDALSYAHAQGMIHRDIKPANIMLTSEEQPILMDFGLVKILNATSHTSTGAIIGTARYMPPEIINDEPADERSDIYSLGITLYELLSSEPPFDADSVLTLLMMHLNDPVPNLNLFRQGISLELAYVIKKSLEKDRNNRYSAVEEMAGDLRRILSTPEPASVSTADFGYLKLKLPDGSQPEIEISKSEITIGRGNTNDIIIEDEQVSRSHARLEFDASGTVKIIDTGSTNGVRVNGVKVNSTIIKPGDVIQIGQSEIRYVNPYGKATQITIVSKK